MTLLLEYRCDFCGNLLMKGLLLGSKLEIKCRRCSRIISLVDETFSDDLNRYVIIYDPEGRIVDISKSAAKVLGYEENELRRKTVHDLAPHVTPEDYKKMWQNLQGSATGIFLVDVIQRNFRGEQLSLRAKLKIHIMHSVAHVLALYEVIGKDGEEPKQVPFVSKNIRPVDFMAEVDHEGNFTYVSLNLARALGYRRSDMLGKPYFDVCDPSERELVRYEFSLMAKAQRAFFVEKRQIVMKNGNSMIADAFVIPSYYANNMLKGFKILYKV